MLLFMACELCLFVKVFPGFKIECTEDDVLQVSVNANYGNISKYGNVGISGTRVLTNSRNSPKFGSNLNSYAHYYADRSLSQLSAEL